jgi:hypothetical protein
MSLSSRSLVLGIALAACGCPPPESPRALERVELPPTSLRLTRADSAKAEQAGAGPAVPIDLRVAVRGDAMTQVMKLPEGECLLLLARGAESVMDLDLFAYTDDGSVLGTDEAVTKDATLLVCPPAPRHVYVAARIANGHGLVAVVGHAVPESKADDVRRALGVAPQPAPDALTDEWTHIERLADDQRQEFGGIWSRARRELLPTDPRVPSHTSVTVPSGGCLHVLATPSSDVSHVDLSALAAEGRIAARADRDGDLRSLLLCSPDETRITLEVRPHVGRGTVMLVFAHAVDGSEVHSARRRDLGAPPRLDAVLTAHEARMRARRLPEPTSMVRGATRAGTRSSFPLTLTAGCHRLDVLVGHPSLGIETWLWDSSDELVARERGVSLATSFACTSGGVSRLDLEPRGRGGPFVVERRSLDGVAAPFISAPLAASRLLARLETRGMLDELRGLPRVQATELGSDRLSREVANVPAGRCLTFVSALGPGAIGLELVVRDTLSGDEIARDRGPYAASARICALDVPRTLRVEASLRVRSGRALALTSSMQSDPRAPDASLSRPSGGSAPER